MPVKKVAKAEGPLGRSVSEVYAQRTALRGKPVRVRGVVVKSVSGVLGRTFLHVRDGSGSTAQADNDLTITTTLQPKLGEEVLLEGKLTTDKDFGMGYTYPVLLEEAVAVSP